jgi:hypothetical protein
LESGKMLRDLAMAFAEGAGGYRFTNTGAEG